MTPETTSTTPTPITSTEPQKEKSKINIKKYIENFVKIRDKNSNIVPLILNKPQQRLYEVIKTQKDQGRPVRIIILKARQMGFSTCTGGIMLSLTTTHKNKQAAIVAHQEDSTTNLFNMYKLMYENLPAPLKPTQKASNAKELVFNNKSNTGLNSRIRCMTAGTGGVGRSFTINYLHISELAFWKGDVKETMLGLMQAVPNTPDSMVIIESTANGYEEYQERWEAAVKGESDFYPLFVGWNELDEYSMPYSGFELTEEEKALQTEYHVSLDQLEWRRWCIKNNCGGDTSLFKQEYPICPEEAFLTTGNCVFDQEKIMARLAQIPEPLKTGYFSYDYDDTKEGKEKLTSPTFDLTGRGYIKIYKEPVADHTYTLSGDTAGDTQGDYFAAHVIDNTTCEQVAVYHNMTDETLFARQMICLGYYYNTALIAIEANFSTYPIKEIVRLGYPNIYVRDREDDYRGGIYSAYGFKTTQITRPLLISSLVDIIRDHTSCINDRDTLHECLTFIVNEYGRKEAMQGKHDDLVMSLGIGYYVRNLHYFQVAYSPPELKKMFKWSEDLKQDYYKADKETRRRMEEKYGRVN